MATVPNQYTSVAQLRSAVVNKDGSPNAAFLLWLQQMESKTQKSLDLSGQIIGTILSAISKIGADASIDGRSASLQTLIQNLTDAGLLNSLGNVVDTSTDHLTDGTGTPLLGGKRGAQALDGNNRLVSSFHQNQVDVTASPLSSTQLSNDGVSTAILIAAGSYQYGPGQIPYNNGSVDPGAFGSYYIYFDDPTFAGGAVTFQFTTDPTVPVASIGRQVVGGIVTSNAGASSGGGYSGGSSGRPGGRGYNTL